MKNVSYVPFYKGSLEIVYEDYVIFGVKYLHGVKLRKNLGDEVPDMFVRYAEGHEVSFCELVLAKGLGSQFDYKVWEAGRLIPYGEVRSYGWLAEKVGGKRYSRAVAMSLSRNPFLLVVPCHRVIRSNGELGGFSSEGGLELKKYLLGLEGALQYVKV